MGNIFSFLSKVSGTIPEPEVNVKKGRKSLGHRQVEYVKTRSSLRLQMKREKQLSLSLSQSATREVQPVKVPLSTPSTPRKGRQRRRLNQDKPKGYFRRRLEKSQKQRYPCSQCGKEYSRKSYRNDHELIHTGIMSFSCEWCLMKFAMRASYKAHVRHCKCRNEAKLLTFGNRTAQKGQLKGRDCTIILTRCDHFG